MDIPEFEGISLDTIIEGLIFASDGPLSAEKISQNLQKTKNAFEVNPREIEYLIDKLNEQYEEEGRAFSIVYLGGGYTFRTREELHPWLKVFQHENEKRKISQSAVEALAIIAYKQPITKPEVDHIRGVDSGYIVRQLMDKGLIEVAGRYDGPGRALLYQTTSLFLTHFGINSIEELPKPREIEEILQDDDMAEHRQFMLELKSDLEEGDSSNGESQSGDGDDNQNSSDEDGFNN